MQGVVLPLDGLAFGDKYDLSPAYLYWKAFGNAGVLMKDWTFDEIAQSKSPPEFDAWWRHDLRSWMAANAEAVEQRMQVA